MPFSLGELANKLNAEIRGDENLLIQDVASFSHAQREHLSYAESKKQVALLKNCQAGALITSPELAATFKDCSIPLLLVSKPQSAFIQAMQLFRPARPLPAASIAASASISPSASLGQDCFIGEGVVIGERVRLGDRCRIMSGAVIGVDCTLGNDCVIYPNAVLYCDVIAGDRVIIHSNAVIAGDGFGYRFENGEFVKTPHTGKVILESDVEIGACATIDRGMIEATVIGRGTKIDNQVMIAHNCQIGRFNAFASQVGLAGSVTTGDFVQMGGKVGIADHITIGAQVKLGGNSGVLADILQPGTYYDSPAVPEVDALKNHINIKRIPELRDQIKQLKKQLSSLQEVVQQLAEAQLSDQPQDHDFRPTTDDGLATAA